MVYSILTICFVTFLSDLTPGPNFWKIVHYTLQSGRSRSMIFIFGLSIASVIHCTLGLLGVSALVASHEMALMAIQMLGGGYIAWYGLQMVRSSSKPQPQPTPTDSNINTPARPVHASARRVLIDGVLTNFSNPKTILFYASLFALTLGANQASPAYQIVVMASLLLTSLLTNMLVACVFAIGPVSRLFRKWQQLICRCIGGLLILGGIKIALQQRG